MTDPATLAFALLLACLSGVALVEAVCWLVGKFKGE